MIVSIYHELLNYPSKKGNYPVWYTDPIPSAHQTWGCKKNIEKQTDGLMNLEYPHFVLKHRVTFQRSKQIETGLITVLTPILIPARPNCSSEFTHSKLGHRKPLQCRIIIIFRLHNRSYCYSFMRKMTFKTCLNPQNLVVISTSGG